MGKESAEKDEWSSQSKYFICKNEMITPQTETLDNPFSWISVNKWFLVGGGWLFTGLPLPHCPISSPCILMPSPCRSTGWTVFFYWYVERDGGQS